jgi:hypothetical protein
MASVTQVPLKNFGEYEKRLGVRMPRYLAQAMDKAGAKVLEHLKQVSARDVRPYTGSFNEGWKREAADRLGSQRIFNDSPHAPYVEGGRAPRQKMPPYDALEMWVQRVRGVASPESRNVAMQLARKIAIFGIKPRHVLKNATPELIKIFARETTQFMDEVLRGLRF